MRRRDSSNDAEELPYDLADLLADRIWPFLDDSERDLVNEQFNDREFEIHAHENAGCFTVMLDFPDYPGYFEMLAVSHWMGIALVAFQKDVDTLLHQRGFDRAGTPAKLEGCLENQPEPFVYLRGELHAIHDFSDGYSVFRGDDVSLSASDLSLEERAWVEKALREQRCRCHVCIAVRAGEHRSR